MITALFEGPIAQILCRPTQFLVLLRDKIEPQIGFEAGDLFVALGGKPKPLGESPGAIIRLSFVRAKDVASDDAEANRGQQDAT